MAGCDAEKYIRARAAAMDFAFKELTKLKMCTLGFCKPSFLSLFVMIESTERRCLSCAQCLFCAHCTISCTLPSWQQQLADGADRQQLIDGIDRQQLIAGIDRQQLAEGTDAACSLHTP